MSRQAALQFIARVENDLIVQSALRRASPGDLDAVVGVAAEAGYRFDVDDLRDAFALDWGMRRRFYSRARMPPSTRSSVAVVNRR